MFKAFICDFVGTLADTEPMISKVEAASFAPYSSTKIDPKWVFNELAGKSWKKKFAAIQSHYDLDLSDKFDEITEFRRGLMMAIAERKDLKPFSNVVSTLTLLKKNGIYGAIASNNSSQERLEKIVAACGLKEIFGEKCYSYGLVGHSKPNPAMLLRAAKDLDCKPEECLFIGDSKTDAQAAKNAGMGFALFTAGAEIGENDPSAELYLRDYKDLPALMENGPINTGPG